MTKKKSKQSAEEPKTEAPEVAEAETPEATEGPDLVLVVITGAMEESNVFTSIGKFCTGDQANIPRAEAEGLYEKGLCKPAGKPQF